LYRSCANRIHRTNDIEIPSAFIYSENKDVWVLENAARGDYHIIYICVEMLEGPSFAKVLHSETFQKLLLAIFIDKAHIVHKSASWRPAYTRLIMLRALIEHHIPFVAISATLPSPYQELLIAYTGLHWDYTLINLGNHRPELSTVVIPMKHEISSFWDIAFLIPFGSQVSDFEPTIIYSDNLDVLTAMFWWAQGQLVAMALPVKTVDILHAGLSPEHQNKCLADFRNGTVKFLLASEKVGVGINFLNVRRVVQYLCRGLTLVRFKQRRGRCARTSGMTGIGYLIAEPRMMDKSVISLQSSHTEDPGLVDLLQSDECSDVVCVING
jgi:superfamily II DNA helicase RecQ